MKASASMAAGAFRGLMRKLWSVCVLLASFSARGEVTLFADAEAWGYAEPVPIHHYAEDWQADLASGSDGFIYERHRLGIRTARYEFARISQRIYEVEPNRDTARLYHRVQNDLPFRAGERFALDLDVRHAAMHGLQVARSFSVDERLRFKPALNLWRANSLLDGRIRGAAVARDGERFDYQLALEYFYTEDKLLDRRVDRPGGYGASLDIDLAYAPAERWHVRLQVVDLLGRIEWRDAPFTNGRARSDNREFDADGFVRFNPTFSGHEGNADFSQDLPARASLTAGFTNASLILDGVVKATPLQMFYGASATWLLRPDLSLGVELIAPGPALGLRVRWKGLVAAYAADSLKFHDANHAAVSLALNWPLPLRM